MNALEFAAQATFPVAYVYGPCIAEYVCITDEADFNFDLGEIDGEVRADGIFVASNLNDGSDRDNGWRFRFHTGAIVSTFTIVDDKARYEAHVVD